MSKDTDQPTENNDQANETAEMIVMDHIKIVDLETDEVILDRRG